MRISNSEIATFLRCRRLWVYSGDSQMHLTPRQPAPALVLGTGIHNSLEYFYAGDAQHPIDRFRIWAREQRQQWRTDGWAVDDGTYDALFDLGAAMLAGYLEKYGDRPEDDPHVTFLITEQEFAVPIPQSDGYFVGRIDGVVRDYEDRLWVIDHKTYTNRPFALHLNPQFTGYTWALQQIVRAGRLVEWGIDPDTQVYGTLVNGLRKQKPGPRVTNDLFLREWVGKSPIELDRFGRWLTEIYREMSRPDLPLYPSLSRECGYCAFRDPCFAAQSGEDEHWLLETAFHRAAPRGSVYASTGDE